MFVPKIQNSLVSGSLLSKHSFGMVFEVDMVTLTNAKHSFCMVFEADMVTLTKAGIYVEKCYMTDGFF